MHATGAREEPEALMASGGSVSMPVVEVLEFVDCEVVDWEVVD